MDVIKEQSSNFIAEHLLIKKSVYFQYAIQYSLVIIYRLKKYLGGGDDSNNQYIHYKPLSRCEKNLAPAGDGSNMADIMELYARDQEIIDIETS